MARALNQKIGEMEFDGLITDLLPQVICRGGTIAAMSAETTLKRGTILAKGDDGTLAIMAEGGNPYCILCDDTTVGTSEAVNASVYFQGCFDPNKCIVADGYTLTEADKDTLRTYGILFKAPETNATFGAEE